MFFLIIIKDGEKLKIDIFYSNKLFSAKTYVKQNNENDLNSVCVHDIYIGLF